MYHLARVLKLFHPDDKDIVAGDAAVQALLEMWDENVLTFRVHPLLSGKIKAGDIVLVEYDFKGPRIPDNTVVKIVRGKTAKDAWQKMKDYFAGVKKRMPAATLPPLELNDKPYPMVR